MEDPIVRTILEKYMTLMPLLNERTARIWAATEARALGRGGVTRVMEATGMSRRRIAAGVREIESRGVVAEPTARQRAPGGGRKRLTERDPGLAADLERLVDPATRGDPEGPLLWTSLSTAKLAAALLEQGHEVSGRTVARMLRAMGYSLQANRKTTEGRQHADRDAQFNHINRRARAFQRRGDPVVSVWTRRRRSWSATSATAGREWRPQGDPERGCASTTSRTGPLGKAIPYGVYDLSGGRRLGERGGRPRHGVVRRGDAAALVAEHGKRGLSGRRPAAGHLPTPAASNGARSRLWKAELQRFADETGAEGVGVPLPARHQSKVEQDRAPDVLPHHAELARPTAGEPRSGGGAHRQHDHRQGADGARRNWTTTSTPRAGR